MLTTDAPEPLGRLDFSVQAAPPGGTAAALPATLFAAGARRRLRMQPGDHAAGWVVSEISGAPAGELVGEATDPAASQPAVPAAQPVAPTGMPSEAPAEVPTVGERDVQPQQGVCGVPAAPALRLRLPAGQRLASVVWLDSLNRTVAVQSGAELAAAASDTAPWTTPAVALPPLYPFAESSSDPSAGCSPDAATCQAQQRSYTVLLLAPDGRHARATITAAPVTLDGQQLEVSYKFYERRQLSYSRASLAVPLAWPAPLPTGAPAGSSSSSSSSSIPAGVVIYDAAAAADGRPLQLRDSAAAVVPGGSLRGSECSRQWSLSMEVDVEGAELAAAAREQVWLVFLAWR